MNEFIEILSNFFDEYFEDQELQEEKNESL